MDAKMFYSHLYALLDEVTPLKVDCGKLCSGACCQGDDAGMYLFPHEEVMYSGKEKWMEILESDILLRGEPVKILVCKGKCDRKKRPLSCRIFPFFIGDDGKVTIDKRANAMCPLAQSKMDIKEFNADFVTNVEKVFKMLSKIKITKDFIEINKEIIRDYVKMEEMFGR
ncbi:MAG: hypothetical protein Q4G23_03945 [Clostridia bacterium]|nr:hypothetical protein [Clostridia bacterium]